MERSAGTVSVFALAMLITGSIDSIRNLPTTALFGTNLIFFTVFSALVLLIPVALVAAELSSALPNEGGIFIWVRRALGGKCAFLAIWMQWINTMVWYPTILSFIAGTAAYLIDPQLADQRWYLMSVILAVFWLLTLVNLRGFKTSTRFASFCAVFGMVIPMAFIILLAAVWLLGGHPLAIHFSWDNLIPGLHTSVGWISLTAVMTSFLGMELATVHVNEVSNPQHAFPRALLISVAIIVTTTILGSLAIALVLPSKDISLVEGIMQAFSQFLHAYHMVWLLPILTLMILLGSLGGMINWVISPAKGLLQAAQIGYLPKSLTKLNRHGVAGRILILQALLVTLSCSAFILMPSVNGSYWLLTDLSTQIYMVMYVFFFIAAVKLHFSVVRQQPGFKIPGGLFGKMLICGLGLFGCGVTILVGFLPPSNIAVGGTWHFEVLFIGGLILMLTPGLMVFFAPKPKPHGLDSVCGEASS